jgi:Rps23 Pro-64 3,4-dihydroxylase Tpa1-like proline 4-hydroxylase
MIKIYENILLEEEILFLLKIILEKKDFLNKPITKDRNYSRIMLSPQEVNTNLKHYLNNIPYVFEKNLFNLNLVTINYIDKDNFKNDLFHFDYSDKTFITYINDDFIGGEFQYIISGEIHTIKPKKNLSILLDSNIKHRVLPVETGHRYSLACFFSAKENLQKKII